METKVFKNLILAGLLLGTYSITHTAAAGDCPGAPDQSITQELINSGNLIRAARTGNLEAVRAIIEGSRPSRAIAFLSWLGLMSYPQDLDKIINQRGADKNTALIVAAKKGHTEIVQELLTASASPNPPTVRGTAPRTSPLNMAAANGHTKTVQALLAAGASPDIHTSCFTPLFIAASNGHTEIVQILLTARASLDLPTVRGAAPRISPLIVAAANGHTKTVQALLTANASPDTASSHGTTPLHEAAAKGHTDAVQALLAAGASPGLANQEGETPLHEAAVNGHTEMAQLIINAYRDGIIAQCPAIAEIVTRRSENLLEQLPLEVAQLIAEWLEPQDVASLRSASTNCRLYASHKFEQIRQLHATQRQKKLIQFIQSATKEEFKAEIITLLEQELKKAEQFDLLTLPATICQRTQSDPNLTPQIGCATAQRLAREAAEAQQQIVNPAAAAIAALCETKTEQAASAGDIIAEQNTQYAQGLATDQRIAALREQIARLTEQAHTITPENNTLAIAPENLEAAHALYQNIAAAQTELVALLEPNMAQEPIFAQARQAAQTATQKAVAATQEQLHAIELAIQTREDAASQAQDSTEEVLTPEELRARRLAMLDQNNSDGDHGDDHNSNSCESDSYSDCR